VIEGDPIGTACLAYLFGFVCGGLYTVFFTDLG
jgi:hypothetical protein